MVCTPFDSPCLAATKSTTQPSLYRPPASPFRKQYSHAPHMVPKGSNAPTQANPTRTEIVLFYVQNAESRCSSSRPASRSPFRTASSRRYASHCRTGTDHRSAAPSCPTARIVPAIWRRSGTCHYNTSSDMCNRMSA